MQLYKPDNTKLLDIAVDDSSYCFKEIMGDNNIVLNYSLPDFIDIPLGSYCMYKGTEKYTLYSPENFKKNHSEYYEYTLILESEQARMKTVKFKHFVADYKSGEAVKMDTAPRLKFSFTGDPYDFARLLADNMNLSESGNGWKAVKENNISSEPVTLDFNHNYCYEILAKVAEAFNTEWEVEKKEIRFAKVEKRKDSAINLSYGYENGILGGISRKQYDASKVINRVWIQGGNRNIDFSKYGNDTLLLPKNNKVRFDGTVFEDEEDPDIKALFDPQKAVEYRTDETGAYVERSERKGSLLEDSLDVSKVYPMREGFVSDVMKENGVYYFEDKDIPDDLDYSKVIIPEEKMTVIFQTGILAGREFQVAYKHDKKQFGLVSTTENGQNFPDDTFKPEVGDKYGVFHIALPQYYITSAEKRARNEAIKYLWVNEQPKFTYDWQLDGIYAKRNWGQISGFLDCGYFVKFSDPQFLPEAVDIRITAVKEYINKLNSPEITISNNVSGKSVGSIINEIPDKEQEIDRKKEESIEFTKRRYRDAEETIGMLQKSLLNFSEGISPITVQTMSLLVGDESLQFRFIDNINKPEPVKFQIKYDKENKRLVTDEKGVILQHMTLGISDITSKDNEQISYKMWKMPEHGWQSGIINDTDKSYYLYAVCKKNGNTGTFEISPNPIKMELTGNDNYYFLTGILNSEFEGERSYVDLYGFTEILPGRITTDRIVSVDGENYFDLANNALRIGNNNSYLDYNSNKDGQLKLKGTLIQSPSGDSSPATVYRGSYQPDLMYYIGDSVKYNGSSYLCIKDTTSGIKPDNTEYWIVIVAKGNRVFSYMGDYSNEIIYSGNDKVAQVVKFNEQYFFTKEIDGVIPKGTEPTNNNYWDIYGASFESIATGLIFAEKADIAGWSFSNQFITAQDNTVYLDGRKDQNIRIAVGNNAVNNPRYSPFRVDKSGNLICSNAQISGKISIDDLTDSNLLTIITASIVTYDTRNNPVISAENYTQGDYYNMFYNSGREGNIITITPNFPGNPFEELPYKDRIFPICYGIPTKSQNLYMSVLRDYTDPVGKKFPYAFRMSEEGSFAVLWVLLPKGSFPNFFNIN